MCALALACVGGGGQLRPVVVHSPGVRETTRLALDTGDTMPVHAGGGCSACCTLQRAHHVLCFARACAP
jgi:hypothetical protein